LVFQVRYRFERLANIKIFLNGLGFRVVFQKASNARSEESERQRVK
jgi:hypothetical protein